MNNQPKVSVIVPIYNMERVLRRCLDSLVSQTEHDFEVILVDDGSTDNSADICEEYAGRDDRLRIVRKKNGGVCSARNAGLDIARGEYVACVDPDDFVDRDHIAAIYSEAKQHDCDIIITDSLLNGEYIRKNIQSSESILADTVSFRIPFMTLWSAFIKRDLIEKNNIRFTPEHLCHYEDVLYLLRLLVLKPKVCYLPKASYHYETGQGVHLSLSRSEKTVRSVIAVAEEIEKVLPEAMKPLAYDRKVFGIYSAFCARKFKIMREAFPELHKRIISEHPFRLETDNDQYQYLAVALKISPWIGYVMMNLGMRIKRFLQRRKNRRA